MPRPKTKDELLELSQSNYKKLIEYINTFSEKDKNAEFPKGTMNRNIRDVIAHLHAWHLMFLGWYKVGMSGEKPVIPAEGYSWKTTPALNRKINKDYQKTDLKKALQLFAKSHAKVQKLIQNHTNEELFEKKRYKWTGTTSIGSYLVGATSSHYDWAYKLIKKAKK